MFGNSNIIGGAELFGPLGRVDTALLEDIGPVGDACEFAVGEFAAGRESLASMAHEQMHCFTE